MNPQETWPACLDKPVLNLSPVPSSHHLDIESIYTEILSLQNRIGLLADQLAGQRCPPAVNQVTKVNPVTPQSILTSVSEFYGVPLKAMKAKSRLAHIVLARQAAIFLITEILDLSAFVLGKLFRCNRSYIYYALDQMQDRCSTNPKHAAKIALLRAIVNPVNPVTEVNPNCPKCSQPALFIRNRPFPDGSGRVFTCTNRECKNHNLYFYPFSRP